VRLTEKETNILKFPHASAGTVPRDILLHEVWAAGVATHTLKPTFTACERSSRTPQKAQILLTEGAATA
jgi:hypothetical protein